MQHGGERRLEFVREQVDDRVGAGVERVTACVWRGQERREGGAKHRHA